MSFNLSLTCLQYTSTEQESVTLKTIKPLIDEAVNHGSNFIALPECATSLQENSSITKELAKPEINNLSLKALIDITKSKKIYLLIIILFILL